MTGWDDAADALESSLLHASLLLDGHLVEAPRIPALDLQGTPDPETAARIRGLLDQLAQATDAVTAARAAAASRLRDLERHREVAGAYLRTL